MQHVTYKDIISRYGKRPAFNLLRTIERLAQIRDEIASIDLDDRFDKAFRAISDTNFVAQDLR